MKRILSIIFILLISMNSFAAIVADNDGIAFVTKIEFDTLKTDFANQITNYNESLDRKIDGAIAQYLAGMSENYVVTNYYDRYIDSTGHKPVWYNSFKVGTSSWNNDISITTVLNHTVDNANNIKAGMACYKYTNTDTRGTYSAYAGTAPIGNQITDDAAQGSYFNSATQSTQNNRGNQWEWVADYPAGFQNRYTYDPVTDKWNVGKPAFTYTKEDYDVVGNDTISIGSGNGWEWQVLNGRKCLKKFNDDFYYRQKLDAYMHSSYNAHSRNDYLEDNRKGNPTSYSITVNNRTTPLGKATYGTSKEKLTISTSQYGEVSGLKVRNNDGTNYLDYLWSIDSDTTLYGADEEKKPTYVSNSTYTIADGSFFNGYIAENIGPAKQVNVLTGGTFTYDTFSFQPDSFNMSDFYSDIESTFAGEGVKNGGGMILLSSTADHDISVTLRIKLTSKSGASKNCSVKLSKNQFNLGAFKTTTDKLHEETFTTNVVKDISLTVEKKGSVWIWLKNTTDTDPITIEQFEIL